MTHVNVSVFSKWPRERNQIANPFHSNDEEISSLRENEAYIRI